MIIVSTFFAIARRTRIQGWRWAAAATALALSLPGAASAAYPGPNGRVFFSAGGDVWSVAADGAGAANLTDLPGGAGSGSDPSVSAGGVVAFVVGAGPAAEIWTMQADGSNARRLTFNAAADAMPSISADGSRIAFVSTRASADADVWTMAADGSQPAALLTAPGDEEHPQFSPDSQYVVMASHVTGDLDLAYVPATGGPYPAATAITHHALDESNPALQPDQVRLAYARAGDILTSYYDGTDEFALAVDPATGERSPAFSPDGTQVVYVTDAGLVVAAAGGASPRPLPTPGAANPADPDWAVGAAVDRAPPQTTITKAPKRRSERKKAKLRFESSEPGSSFQCRLDKQAFKPCDSPQTYRRLGPRRHRFAVEAIDAAGNVDPSPARARFRVLEGR